VISSHLVVTKRSKMGRISQPDGGVITPSDTERSSFRRLRQKNGWSTRWVAAKIGCSNGTVTNFETKGTQIKRKFYLGFLRLLAIGDVTADETEEMFRSIAAQIAPLDKVQLELVQSAVNLALAGKSNER
jgi:hypothetical protein